MIDRLNSALTDRYLIERELGEGGMATVYLAEDLRHHRKVAVKVLKPELAAVVGGERFVAEIETTARLQHPNILPLFDSGEADGFLFYVMPLVEGESLRDRLKREKQLPVADAVRIATEVAEALHSAHQAGVVHRDIKPENIMLSQGRPLVADFGIALAVSTAGGHRLTDTGLSLGTPHYMSPEQATGDQVIGPPSDIYSLGCVLYEMLVGDPPYSGSTAQAILGKVITSDPESVTSQRRAVPRHVDAVVARALEKLPADRFTSALDFAVALADETFRHGTGARGEQLPGRTRTLAVAGWGMAVVAGALWLFSASETTLPLPIRKLSLATLDGDGPSEWFALTPDGSALVISDAVGRTGRSLSVRRLDDLVRIPIKGSEGAIDPAISPDGQMVAFGRSNGGGLVVTPLVGGSVRTLEAAGIAQALRWNTDGYIYYGRADSIYRVRATGGEPELVLTGDGEMLGYYQLLDGGQRAVLSVLGEPNRLEMMDVESGDRVILAEGIRGYVTTTGHLIFARGDGNLFAAPLDVKQMELSGSPVLLVEGIGTRLDSRDAYYTLSESGDLVYWTSARAARDVRELIWVDRKGGVTSVDTAWSGEFESVELSPDGTRAAVTVGFLNNTEIWIKVLDDGPARRLTNYQGMNRRPVWSPDGSSLAFISDRGGRRAAYVVPVDGIGTPELLFEHKGEDVDEVFWSSDGNWFIYRTGTSSGARDIYARRLRPDTATIAVSAQPGVDESAPVLSPDGRWVAYVSDQTGEAQVWVRPFPDVDRGSRQVSVDLGIEPVWANDGEELFLRSRPGFLSVAVRTGNDFSSGELQRLFANGVSMLADPHRGYAFDGRTERFLMIRVLRREETPAELILVQNFLEEVKARVGN